MKLPKLFKFAICAVLASVLLLGCKSAIEALRMSTSVLGNKKKTEQTEPPKFYSVEHSSHSDLPTIIDFLPDADLNKDNFSTWVTKEMKVDIQYQRSTESVDGSYHYYQQYHNDIPVYGAQYSLLIQDGKPVSAFGMLFKEFEKINRAYNSDQLINSLEEKYPMWWFNKNLTQSYFPLNQDGNTKLVFTYKVAAMHKDEEAVIDLYIDASTGQIVGLEETEIYMEIGNGVRSNGKQVSFGSQDLNDIPLEYRNSKWSSGYRLFDVSRNLHTLTAGNQGKKSSKEDFLENIWEDYVPAYKSLGEEIIETDNFWDQSNQAIDVHWGLQKSYDYFLQNHGRKGYDGANGYLPALVNYRKNYPNAAFIRKYKFLKFGDGNPAKGIGPYTSLGIVGHEYTHALVYSICKLSSNGESGSISESLADIFGTTIEFSVEPSDWIHGNEVPTRNPRSLKDPKSTNQPDTYQGDNWRNTLMQNLMEEWNAEKGIKHHNAGIMNHWYYLLCEGGKDENDNKDHYNIKPIGMKNAAAIVYQALFRLHPTIDFEGMRKITTDIAKKKYGKCSDELKNVTNAWNAVGVGDPFCDCFEGSYVLVVQDGKKTNKATFYYKGDKSAVEVLDKDGNPHIVNTSAGDPLRHVQGHPDLPANGPSGVLLRQMFQGKNMVLTNPPPPFVSRKAYVEYRNKHRTGRKKDVDGYTAYEYKVPDGTFWSTDEVCTSLIDMGSLYAHIGPNAKKNNFRVFFGFPVKMTVKGESYTIENLREYKVPDSIFSR